MQPDVCVQKALCEVQTGELEMFPSSFRSENSGLNQDASLLFLVLPLTHHVTLDQSTELLGPKLFPRKEKRMGEILCFLFPMCVQSGDTAQSFQMKDHSFITLFCHSLFDNQKDLKISIIIF